MLPLLFVPPVFLARSSRFHKRLSSVRFEYADGSGMTVGPSEGNLTIGPKNAANRQKVAVYDRGAHDGFVLTDDLIQDISLTLQMVDEVISSAVANRIHDFMVKEGMFASSTSVDDTIADCFKMITTYASEDGTVITGEVYPKCEGEIAGPNDGSPFNTWNISIRNHVAPTRWTGSPP